MGKKFKKRFRGLCPCTKTSPTPEVEDGGKVDTGCKVGVLDNRPEPHTVKARHPPLSRFNKMILEIEAMYANITHKLDQRHKSLDEYAKFIFGDKYTNTTVKQDGASVIPNQSKCDTPLREETHEIKHTHIDSQQNKILQSLQQKERKDDNKDKERPKLSTFSDRILYRWMTKHLQASEENEANVVEKPSNAASSESIKDEKPTHDEIGTVVYVIDRVFIVGPRIDFNTEVQKADKPGDVFTNSVHKIGKCIDVKKADVAWRFRTIPGSVSDFTMSQAKHKVESRISTIANTLESPNIIDRPFIVDYQQIYGTVSERNKALNPFLAHQRVEMHGNGQQVIVSLAFSHPSQTHLQATSKLVQIAVPIDILAAMFSTRQHVQITSALSQLAKASRRDQIHMYKQVVQIFSAFIHRFAVGQQVKMHGSKVVTQILPAISHVAPLSRPDYIPGYTQAMIISLEFGQQVPIAVRSQMPGHKPVMILSIAFGQPASLDFRAQGPRTKKQVEISVTPFDHLAQIRQRTQLPESRQLMKTFQAAQISVYDKQMMQISADFGFRAAIDPGALVPENKERMKISKHVIRISLASGQPVSIFRLATKQQMKLFPTFGQYAPIELRAQMPSTEHLKQKFQALCSLAPIDLRVRKPGILPMGYIFTAIGHLVSSSPRAKKPGKEKYGQICKAFNQHAMTCLKTRKPQKDKIGNISVILDRPLLTRHRVQRPENENMEPGRHFIALEYIIPTCLQAGTVRERQIGLDHLAIGHIDTTAQRSQKHKTQQMRQILLATNGGLGQISLRFGQHSQTNLRTRKTGSDQKGQIMVTFVSLTPFHQHAPKLGYKLPGQIVAAFGHPAFRSQYSGQLGSDPMTQISLASGNNSLILKLGKDHMGQIFLTFGNRPQITQRVQHVGEKELRQIFLALAWRTLTRLFAQTTGNVHFGRSVTKDNYALTSLQADKVRAIPQIFSAVGSDASTSKIAMNIHITNISGYISLMSRQSPFAILKDAHTWPNVGGCITSPAVETLTRLPKVTIEIAFKVSPAKKRVFSLEMRREKPICDILGPSHRIGELFALESTTKQPSVGPDIESEGSSKTTQSANSYVLNGKLTTLPETDTFRIILVMTKPVNIKRPKGKPATEEVRGMFGQWRFEDKPVGLKHVFSSSPAIEDLSMLRPSPNTDKWYSDFTWTPTANLTSDRLGLCLTADLMARLDNNADKTADADTDTNKTSVTAVRSISIGTATDNTDHDDEDPRKTTRVRDSDNRKERNTTHNGDLREEKTIPKYSSRRSRKEMQDKGMDTTDLHNLSLPTPVVSKVPVPGSTFGRVVLKHEVVGNLQDLMDRGAPLDENHAKFLCINLLDILKYLLSRGVIHTDICPRNIAFDEFGYPCLTGYDKSIFIGSDPHTRRKFRPAIEYCSPEQAMKTYITEATDVFSVGVLCFNVVYGRPPHQGRTYKETRDNITNNNFIPKFEPDGLLSKSGKFFLVSCIRKDLDKRFSVRKCGTSLVRSVKWFNDYDEKALLSHKMPSPFLQILKD